MCRMKDIESFVEGKQVFVGLDVHKRNWVVCFLCDGEILEQQRIKGEYYALSQLLQKYRGCRSLKIVYEAGFSGTWLYRALVADGYSAIITPPSLFPQSADKVKTDKRDAKKLASYLAAKILKSVYVLPAWAEADRSLIRRRRQVVKNCTRVKARIRSLLNLHGIHRPDDVGKGWGKRYLAWLADYRFEHVMWRKSLDSLLEEYELLTKQEKALTRDLEELAKSDRYAANYVHLTAAKGVGLITAMTFLLEVYDVGRFSNSRQFGSILGLTPSQHSSGEHVRQGRITRQGSAYLRGVLVECAWTMIRHDPHLRAKYERLRARGNNSKKAIVATARTMAIRMRRCLLDGVDYDVSMC